MDRYADKSGPHGPSDAVGELYYAGSVTAYEIAYGNGEKAVALTNNVLDRRIVMSRENLADLAKQYPPEANS